MSQTGEMVLLAHITCGSGLAREGGISFNMEVA